MQKLSKIVAVVGGSGFLLALVAKYALGIVINTTPSAAPVGIYRSVSALPVAGDLVQVCLPHIWARFAQTRGYIGGGGPCADQSMPLVKQVGGTSWSQIYIPPESILPIDSHGRPMPHFVFGKYTVPLGEIWLHGDDRNSFDSRYFGPVPEGYVQSVLVPVITW